MQGQGQMQAVAVKNPWESLVGKRVVAAQVLCEKV